MVYLLLDTNYLLNTSVGYLERERKLYDSPNFDFLQESDAWQETLLEQFMTSVINRLRNYTHWDQIFIISDPKLNWRKEIYPEYKGKRIKKDTIDWKWVYQTYERFLKNINASIKFSTLHQYAGLEADDWCTWITKNAMNRGISCVIASGDGDFKQLVKTDWKNFCYTIQWKEYNMSNIGKWNVPNDLQILKKSVEQNYDPFEPRDMSSWKLITKISQTSELINIQWEEELFLKLIHGDKGDNIPSIYYKTQNLKIGGTREVGVGEASAKKIWAEWVKLYDNPPDFLKNDWIPLLADLVLEQQKVPENLILYKKPEVIKAIHFNRQLMHLDQKWWPETLIESFSQYVEQNPVLS